MKKIVQLEYFKISLAFKKYFVKKNYLSLSQPDSKTSLDVERFIFRQSGDHLFLVRALSGHDPGLVQALHDLRGIVDGDFCQAIDAGDSVNCHFGKLQRVIGDLRDKKIKFLTVE